MEAQLHRTYGRDHEDPLHSADVHGEDERGRETRSVMKKVKEKVDKLTTTIEHGHHGRHGGSELIDEAETVNNSAVVRSCLVEPTVMGTPVLAEDLYATHSDILDPPVRSFAQWQDEEKRGSPPPLSTAYETCHTDLPHGDHHAYGGDGNREQLNGSIGKPTGLKEERHGAPPLPPPSTGYESLTDTLHVGCNGQDVNREPLMGSITGYESLTDRLHVGRNGQDVNREPLMGSITGYESPTDQLHVGRNGQDANREPSMGSIGNPTGLEERYSAPPLPLSASYETPPYDEEVNRELFRGSIGSPTGLEEEGMYGAPPSPVTGIYDAHGDEDLNSYTVPTGISTSIVEENTNDTGGREVRITEVNYIGGN